MNQDIVNKIDQLLDELNSIDEQYKEATALKKAELESLISQQELNINRLSDEIEELKATVAKYEDYISKASSNCEKLNNSILELTNQSQQLKESEEATEKRLSVLMEALSIYEKCKAEVDTLLSQQDSIKIELHNFESRADELKKSETIIEDRLWDDEEKIKNLENSIVYKALIENDAASMKILLDMVTDHVVKNVQVKNALFKSKLSLERK